MAKRISIPPLTENNLIRNNCFGQGLEYYLYTGTGNAEVIAGPPAFCRFSQGRLSHIFDIDNQVHSAPESVFPFYGKEGKGKSMQPSDGAFHTAETIWSFLKY